MVGLDGLEPSTSRLSGARSNHLSYRPLFLRWSLIRVHLHGFPVSNPRLKSGSRLLVSCFLRAVIGCGTAAGGDEGNRTLDPLLAGQVLSQLSYTPIKGLLRKRSSKIEQQEQLKLVLKQLIKSVKKLFLNTEVFLRSLPDSP